ncbi:MAG: TIGR02302 family protein, partial [Hyphomicrobium sp.]
MPEPRASRSPSDKAFKRKVRASKWVLLFERLWPRLWLIIGLAGLFLLVSLLGVWSMLDNIAHAALLAAFGVAGLAVLLFAARVRFPTQEEAVRRIERVSGIPHRPASSYEDTITANADDPRTNAIWQAHRARLAKALSRLRVDKPHPRTDRADPIALRALVMLGVIALAGLVGDSAADRIRSAFRFDTSVVLATARLDAWVTPPPYTDRPPVMLADGSLRAKTKASGINALIQVPEKSVLIVRATGAGLINLRLEVLAEGANDAVFVEAQRPEAGASTGSAGEVSELRLELTNPARVRVLASGAELERWTFDVIADNAPKIAHAKDPARTRRGSLRLNYKVEDDYGVASAEVKLKKVAKKEKSVDPGKAWARPETLKGPRLPLERPPELKLRLPRAGSNEAQTYFDFGPHPWAGREVILTLEAKDVAGNVGRSAPIKMILPERQFQKPLARALVEQRRKLLEDSRYRGQVLRALEALTLEPEGFIDSASIYLGLRTIYHSLRRDETREGMKSVTDGLWDLALRIENGDLSDAEKALREAQEKLADALEKGAPDAELKALMQQLREALKNYVDQMSKDAAKNEMAPPEGLDQENQQMSQEDLQRMMEDLENMALNGSREQAQRMLAELRDLLERLQSGQMSKSQAERGQMMMKKLDELGDIVGQQQRLMDETFRQHRRQGRRGPRSGEGTP